MKMDEIRKIAQANQIKAGSLPKPQLIRAIQVDEGNEPCFNTGHKLACGQDDCLWRDDCQ